MDFSQKAEEIEYLNPLDAYEAVRGDGTYLLQSIGSQGKKARFTIIGFNPLLKIEVRRKVQAAGEIADEIEIPDAGDTIDAIRKIHSQLDCGDVLDTIFTGGLVGYVSYDIIRDHVGLDSAPPDVPKTALTLCRNNIIYDHATHKTVLTDNAPEGDGQGMENAREKLETPPEKTPECTVSGFRPNQTEQEFMDSVEKAKHHIREGDIFQAVLSQRLTSSYSGDPFKAYRRLLSINPSPYMYFLDMGDIHVAGSSPETMVRAEGRKAYTYPIAGTRKRGADAIEDMELERELSADEKEQAEHVMLVDLGRNDLGRVCEYGSVKVTKYMQPEYFSHVMHLSSEVEGILHDGKDMFDAFQSVFPAGTVSGAPKVRAMQIIDELEPEARGIYAGAVGYFSFNGNMDTAITIRTLVFRGGKAHAQAGAGIVADSQPRLEYKETMNKAGAMLKTMEARE